MFIKHFTILLLILAVSLPLSAGPSGLVCEDSFRVHLLSHDQGHQLDESDTLTYRAFEVVGKNQGIHGGERIVVRRTGSWFDFEKELKEKGDLVIDLRFFPHVLGEKEAYFFGYEIIDEYHISLPNVDEINGAIEKYNSLLPTGDPRKILLRYYSIPEVHNTVNEYVGNFRERLAIPISSNGKSFFHDTSAHSMRTSSRSNRGVF